MLCPLRPSLVFFQRETTIAARRSLSSQTGSAPTRPLISWIQEAFSSAKDSQDELRFRLEQACYLHESGMKEGAQIIAESLKTGVQSLKSPHHTYLLPMTTSVFLKVAETDRKLANKIVGASIPLAKWEPCAEFEQGQLDVFRHCIPSEKDLYKLSCHPQLFPGLADLYSTLSESLSKSFIKEAKTIVPFAISSSICAADFLLWGNRGNQVEAVLNPVLQTMKAEIHDEVSQALILSRFGAGLVCGHKYQESQTVFEDSLELLKKDKDSFLLPPTAQEMGHNYYKNTFIACEVLSFLGEKAIIEEKYDYAEKYYTFSLKGVEKEASAQKSRQPHWKSLQAKNLHGLARIYTHQRNPIISEGLYRNAIQQYEEAFSANDWRLLPVMRDFLSMLKASSKRSTALLEKRIAQVSEFNEQKT